MHSTLKLGLPWEFISSFRLLSHVFDRLKIARNEETDLDSRTRNLFDSSSCILCSSFRIFFLFVISFLLLLFSISLTHPKWAHLLLFFWTPLKQSNLSLSRLSTSIFLCLLSCFVCSSRLVSHSLSLLSITRALKTLPNQFYGQSSTSFLFYIFPKEIPHKSTSSRFLTFWNICETHDESFSASSLD